MRSEVNIRSKASRSRYPQNNKKLQLPPASLKKLHLPTPSKLIRAVRNSPQDGREEVFLPPEDWHEPNEEEEGSTHTTQQDYFRIIRQSPGKGYTHAVTEDEVRAFIGSRSVRFQELFNERVDIVQLSRMTKKKKTLPCYGMQWGASIYLYPIESSFVEEFDRPPKTAVYLEAKTYGGRWKSYENGAYQLIWTPETLRDFYLHNILIHEFGHMLDDRNSSYIDRERYAEAYAIEHGQRPFREDNPLRRKPVRRHHSNRKTI